MNQIQKYAYYCAGDQSHPRLKVKPLEQAKYKYDYCKQITSNQFWKTRPWIELFTTEANNVCIESHILFQSGDRLGE